MDILCFVDQIGRSVLFACTACVLSAKSYMSTQICQYIYLRHLGKLVLWRNKKEQVLIRRCTFCAASDQSLDFLSHMSICRKHFSRFLHNLKTMNTSIWKRLIGKHCLLLHKLGFTR